MMATETCIFIEGISAVFLVANYWRAVQSVEYTTTKFTNSDYIFDAILVRHLTTKMFLMNDVLAA